MTFFFLDNPQWLSWSVNYFHPFQSTSDELSIQRMTVSSNHSHNPTAIRLAVVYQSEKVGPAHRSLYKADWNIWSMKQLKEKIVAVVSRMWIFGWKGPSGFSARSTAEEVTQGIDGTGLTAIVTGLSLCWPSLSFSFLFSSLFYHMFDCWENYREIRNKVFIFISFFYTMRETSKRVLCFCFHSLLFSISEFGL